eukprot:COSAG04_NODE_2712_length_3696_cov_54.879344_3_plen_167_part_00
MGCVCVPMNAPLLRPAPFRHQSQHHHSLYLWFVEWPQILTRGERQGLGLRTQAFATAELLVQWGKEQGPYSRIPLRGETQERKELREAMRKTIAEEKKQKEECSGAPQAAATAALGDGHDDEVATSGDGGTNATVGETVGDDTLETERSDSQPSQAGPYLTGSAQK